MFPTAGAFTTSLKKKYAQEALCSSLEINGIIQRGRDAVAVYKPPLLRAATQGFSFSYTSSRKALAWEEGLKKGRTRETYQTTGALRKERHDMRRT